MAVYYKFKSAKDYDSILIEGQFISVLNLKERIFESKLLGSGTDFDLMVSNAQSNEEYVDEAAMIPKNTSVLIRRIPRGPQKTIITERDEPKVVEDKVEDLPPQSSTLIGDSSTMRYPEESEWDEFGNDLYAIPEVIPSQPSKPVMDVLAANKVDEDSKIKALIDTPALDWNSQTQDNGAGRGFRRGGRMMGSRGFGRGGLDRKTPPAGYVCYRCNVPGHFIQHCPTNGDANYDIRRVKPPTGIPKSMLMATPDGSYALPSGAVAVLKPNEAAFEKEIEGLPTARPVSDLPPELHCPLCKEVMKDAVLTSKCCFRSFCDKCIRDHLITRSVCVCGNSNTLADDLLPNKTLRETISRILESKSSSTENAGSMVQVQDMESARLPSQKTLSPDLSAALNNEHKPQMIDHSLEMKEGDRTSETKARNAVMTLSDKDTINANVSQATPEAVSKEPMLVPPESTAAPGGIKEKQHIGEQGKKKKKKKTHLPCSADMHWRNYHDVGVENFAGMALAASMYQPYWSGGMPLGMDGYMAPLGGPVPCVGYTPSPFDVPFGGGIIPRDPFASQGLMMPVVQRDLSELGVHSMGMSMNQGFPVKSRGEFEATKVNMRCKREMEHHNDRRGEHSKERELRRESSGINDGSSVRSKPLPMSRSDRADRAPFVDRRGSPRNRIRQSPQRPGKRTAAFTRDGDGDGDADAVRADRKQKVFPDASDAREGVSKKKRKPSSSEFPKEHLETSSHRAESRMGWSASHRSGGRYDHGSSEEEEYHLKRRPSASSRREAVESEEKEVRRSRGSTREREPRERRGREHVYGHERPASERRSVVCEREREFMY